MKKLITNKLNLTLFGVLIMLICSCEESIPIAEQKKPLFPLNVGNSWSYKGTYYESGNSETVQMNVVSSYTIDGINGFALNEYKKGYPISLLENDENGNLVEHFFDKDKLVHTTIFFKKNVQKGDTWIYKAAIYTDSVNSMVYERIEDLKATCITTDTLITTPKGDFHCIGFSYDQSMQANGDYDTMIFYLSENIGIIKYLLYEHINDKTYSTYEQSLTDYSLKNNK